MTTTPVKDEDFKLFANLRIFGKQMTSFHASSKLGENPLDGMLTHDVVSALMINGEYKKIIKDVSHLYKHLVIIYTFCYFRG